MSSTANLPTVSRNTSKSPLAVRALDSDTHPYASVAGSEVRHICHYSSPPRPGAEVYLSYNLRLQLVLVLLKGHPHKLSSGPHAGLLEQALQDRLYVALGDLQPPGDLLVGEPFQHEVQHLALAIVEQRRRGPVALGGFRFHVGERRVEPDAAGHHHVDARAQIAERRLFEEDAGHSLADQPSGFGVAHPGRHHQHPALEPGLARRR